MSRFATVSLVSFPTLPPEEPERLARTLQRMAGYVDEAARRQSDLVVFPETCNYLASGPTAFTGEPLDGPTLTAVSSKASENGIYVVCPLVTEHDGVRHNSSVLIGRDGAICGIYHKNFPTHEELDVGIIPGTETPVFETDFGRVGLCICFDLNYWEVGSGLGAGGAELVIWSSMWPGVRRLMRWPVEFGFHMAACCSNRSTFVDVAGREIVMTRRNIHDATDGAVAPITTATLDLDRRLLCHDYNVGRLKAVAEKYGSSGVYAEWIRGECLLVFGSLMADVPTDRIMEEFDMETMRDYLARARRSRRRALDGSYRPGPEGAI